MYMYIYAIYIYIYIYYVYSYRLKEQHIGFIPGVSGVGGSAIQMPQRAYTNSCMSKGFKGILSRF